MISAMSGIINRNTASIRSHAQKHFINLWAANKPLPAKVAASGGGYTLSGAPLDPNSGAARMYAKQKTRALGVASGVSKANQRSAGVIPKSALPTFRRGTNIYST